MEAASSKPKKRAGNKAKGAGRKPRSADLLNPNPHSEASAKKSAARMLGPSTNETLGKRKRGEHLKPYHFKPGNPGGGRPKGSRSITAIIRRMLNEGVKGKDVAHEIALEAIKQAKRGNFQYFREIVERIDGKIPDHMQLTGIASGPVQVEAVQPDVIRAAMNKLEGDPEAAAAMDLLSRKLIDARTTGKKPDDDANPSA